MLLLLAHAASTLVMTGLIWFVQVVHYPLFHHAAAGDFPAFAAEHQRRTSLVVVPPMILEMLTASALVLLATEPGRRRLAVAGWLLLVAIWLLTALVQVPLHRRLARGFSAEAARRLVWTNWGRTAGWTLRAGVALALLLPP